MRQGQSAGKNGTANSMVGGGRARGLSRQVQNRSDCRQQQVCPRTAQLRALIANWTISETAKTPGGWHLDKASQAAALPDSAC